jgi:hypothetical protein
LIYKSVFDTRWHSAIRQHTLANATVKSLTIPERIPCSPAFSIFQIVETNCSYPGMSPTALLSGLHEIEADLAGCPELHMRAAGGGWAVTEQRDPELEQALETVLALETACDRTASQGQSHFIAAIEHGTEEKERCRQLSNRLKAVA